VLAANVGEPGGLGATGARERRRLASSSRSRVIASRRRPSMLTSSARSMMLVPQSVSHISCSDGCTSRLRLRSLSDNVVNCLR
jgi:hypothetical protein